MNTNIITNTIINWENKLNKDLIGDVFFEQPVDLETFLYSAQFLHLPKLSPKQFEFVSYGVNILFDKENKKLGWKQNRRVGELVALWGKGSGKDFCSQIIQCRIAYILLCLNSPQKYYGLAPLSSIDMLNMAYNADQANFVFFNTFCAMIDNCEWFNNKTNIHKNEIEFDKRVFAYSGHSYEEAFEGKNLILCVLDEISAFKTKLEIARLAMRRLRAPRYSAESVYDMAKSSIETRFGNGIGKLISLSFPRFKNDVISQLYNNNINECTAYTSFGATWDINPKKLRKDFDDEFRKNPERASTKYACVPLGIEEGFFTDKSKIDIAFPVLSDDKVPTTFSLSPTIKPYIYCNHSFPCVIHIDLGLKKDKAGLCVAHVSSTVQERCKNDDNESVLLCLPVVTTDIITSFIAPINGEIIFSDIRNFIFDLLTRKFIIQKVTSDSWNSADFLQILHQYGLETEILSVDRKTDAYDTLKELIYSNRLKAYSYIRKIDIGIDKIVECNEIVEELYNLIFTGRKVDHPGHSSKDVADAVAGAVFGAVSMGFNDNILDEISLLGDRENIIETKNFDREYLLPLNREYLRTIKF